MPSASILAPRAGRLLAIAEGAGWAGLLAALCWACFAAGADLWLFALPPVLLAVALRTGLSGALAGIGLVGCAGTMAAMPGTGPFAAMPAGPMPALSAFLLSALALCVIGVLVQRRCHAQLAAQDQFLASISHDIRTPMAGVLGFADLLLHDDLSPAQRRSVAGIARSGETMVRLLNDILDVSQLAAGRLRLERGAVALHDELRWSLALFEAQAAARGLELDCAIDRFVPALIEGDALRLRQVLLNLVGNAIKFTDHGRVAISAHARRGWRGGQIVITVEDTGIGIAPDKLARVFDRYDRAGLAAGARGGSGLGLAIASQIVAQMGGRIDAASTPGQGSRFTVTLPLRELADAADQARAGEDEAGSPVDPPAGRQVNRR